MVERGTHTGECFLRPSKNDGTDVFVLVEVLESIKKLQHEAHTECVEGLRAVESDKCNAGFGLGSKDELILLRCGRHEAESGVRRARECYSAV